MQTIFHVDMDAFFVSVEELYDPSLKGKAVIVGGKGTERGVVSAASYEARKFGVHSAMPLRTAAKLCPHALFVEGHMDRYRDHSAMVYEVLNRFTPLVSMASIDEAYLDMTGTARLHGPPFQAAHKLHDAVREVTRLNCSIGIASSRLVAKVTSDQAKPNGILWIVPGAEAAFLGPLDVRKIPGVGKVTERRLHRLGIRKVRDLAQLEEPFLREQFGEWGLAMAGKAQGLDAGAWYDTAIGERADPKSISHEHTFSVDLGDIDPLEATLSHLCGKVARRLREHGLYARTIQLKLRFSDFTTITRAQSLANPTQLDIEVIEAARRLFRANWQPGTPIRLIGVHVSSFGHEEAPPGLLDGDRLDRWKHALSAADRLRDRFGESAVVVASGMKGAVRERVQENPADLPGKS